ncbi:hypothetical protein GCM10020369_26620 [Cryptosporangium minutisporangium]|uniref:Transposase n=1 Tax=Cryptosporangium minutisporangium TaxID=113569 RepID=A0ABP6SVY6_9ACTN
MYKSINAAHTRATRPPVSGNAEFESWKTVRSISFGPNQAGRLVDTARILIIALEWTHGHPQGQGLQPGVSIRSSDVGDRLSRRRAPALRVHDRANLMDKSRNQLTP